MPRLRWSVALACAGLLLAACQPSSDTVIGVRAHSEVSAVSIMLDPAVISASVAADLAASDRLIPIEGSLTQGELPLDSTLTFNQRERLATFQQIGFVYIQDRLTALAGARGNVVVDPSLLDWQKANLIALLDGATANLSQILTRLERDQTLKSARVDSAKVLRLRVFVVVLPLVRLLTAGYQLQRLAVIYSHQRASLQQSVNAAQASGKDVTVAQAAVNDLAAKVNAINQDSAAGLAQLQGLTAAGYPGNKHFVLSARGALGAGKYASDQAANDVARARAALGL